MRQAVPLVLHRLVDGPTTAFEDVTVERFRQLCTMGRGRFVDPSGAGAETSSGRPVLLTFDDGYESDLTHALPALAEAGGTAMFFIVTGFVGRSGHLSWNQVRTLHSQGMIVGSHTVSHPDLRRIAPAQQLEELRGSRQALEDHLGAPVTTFSFPFGGASSTLIQRALESGYASVFTSRHGTTDLPSAVVPRNSVNALTTEEQLREILTARATTRIRWAAADLAKSTLRSAMGDGLYRRVRRFTSGA